MCPPIPQALSPAGGLSHPTDAAPGVKLFRVSCRRFSVEPWSVVGTGGWGGGGGSLHPLAPTCPLPCGWGPIKPRSGICNLLSPLSHGWQHDGGCGLVGKGVGGFFFGGWEYRGQKGGGGGAMKYPRQGYWGGNIPGGQGYWGVIPQESRGMGGGGV